MRNAIYDTRAWRATRRRAFERDGHTCQIRLAGCQIRANAVDHIVELADGGAPYELENVQAACRSCNTAKRNSAQARRGRRRLREW